MSFGLGRGRRLDAGDVGVAQEDLPAIPDEVFGQADPAPAGPDPRAWFSEPARAFEIEIGSGKGTFLVEEGARRGEVNFLGIEWAREFYLYTADRCRRRGLTNVRVLHADAVEFLRWRLPRGIVRAIHLYFSDPWPKARHHKRRVVQDEFLRDAHRALEPGGALHVVTDHAGYWAWMESRFARWTDEERGMGFERREFEAAGVGGELVGTNFERKYMREGRAFFATTLVKPASRGGACGVISGRGSEVIEGRGGADERGGEHPGSR